MRGAVGAGVVIIAIDMHRGLLLLASAPDFIRALALHVPTNPAPTAPRMCINDAMWS